MEKTKNIILALLILVSSLIYLIGCEKEDKDAFLQSPIKLYAHAQSPSQINLEWDDNSNNEEGFIVERKTETDNDFIEIAVLKKGITLYQDTEINPETIYYYRICAFRGNQKSSYSEIAIAIANVPESVVINYPAPSGIVLSDEYSVEVNGKTIDLYQGSVGEYKNNPEFYGGEYAFGIFDFSNPVNVKITTTKDLSNLKIQPLPLGITPKVIGNTILFTLVEPAKLSIEPNGKSNPLLLFGNSIEVDPPHQDDPNVIYYGPGIHTPSGGTLDLNSNQTLYLAGGAVLRAGITAHGNNIRICGRGILDCNPWKHLEGPRGYYPLFIRSSSNVQVEGLTIWGAYSWTIPIGMSDLVTISNVKICGSRVWNDDGIDICSSSRVTIDDCFIRSDDDCIAIKGFTWGQGDKDVSDITIKNCTFWCDRARVILLGHESFAKYMQNIDIKNIDIIHYVGPPIILEPINEMTIKNVQFDDIKINGEGQYIDFFRIQTTTNLYHDNSDCVYGYVDNIVVNNLELTDNPSAQLKIIGYSGHLVENVTFNHLIRSGDLLSLSSPGVFLNDYVSNIQFIP